MIWEMLFTSRSYGDQQSAILVGIQVRLPSLPVERIVEGEMVKMNEYRPDGHQGQCWGLELWAREERAEEFGRESRQILLEI